MERLAQTWHTGGWSHVQPCVLTRPGYTAALGSVLAQTHGRGQRCGVKR